jgi:3-oxoacyl-[acyl-carrier protein] reductase
MKLSDLRVIITGAASGMGKHFSLRLCEAGAKVAAFDIDEAGLKVLADEASGLPGELKTWIANVADEDQAVSAVAEAGKAFGGINGLVNNAGIFRDGLLVKKDRKTGEVKKMPLSQWQSVIDIDLTGPFLMTREVAAQMVEMGTTPGVIVNMSSVARAGNMGQSNYSAAKAGLVADTKVWGAELARYGVRVGAVAPGFIRTPILEGMRPEMLEKMMKTVPLRRMGEPEEIYQAVRFIIECDYFTGRCIDVDGGVVL